MYLFKNQQVKSSIVMQIYLSVVSRLMLPRKNSMISLNSTATQDLVRLNVSKTAEVEDLVSYNLKTLMMHKKF